MHFEPLDICKYETNGERSTIYGFHNTSMGFVTDVYAESKKNQSNFAQQAKKSIARATTKKYNLAYCPKSDGNSFPKMPAMDEGLPDDWKMLQCDAFNVVFSHYPIFTLDHEITKRVNLGGHYGD